MASVKISDRLYRDIVRTARNMVSGKYEKIKNEPPKIDMETIYNKLISVEEQSLLSDVPKKYFKHIGHFVFKGFTYPTDEDCPPELVDVEQRSISTNDCSKPWHNREDNDGVDTELGNENGCSLYTSYSGVEITCHWNDSRWDYLKDEYLAWAKKLYKQSQENTKFVDGVEKIASSFGTVRKMVQAYPFMWDLVPQEDKDRANAPVEKRDTAQQVAEKLDVDKDKLNAIVTFDKITRGGNNDD